MIDLYAEAEAMDPGSDHSGFLSVGTLASGNTVGVPYTLFRGRDLHPFVWINGAVHGHESPSSATLAMLVRTLRGKSLNGTVLITPVANPSALDSGSKESPQDHHDLDESFPGREFLFTDRVANTLCKSVTSRPDLLVSVHSNGAPMLAPLYAVYKEDSRFADPDVDIMPLMKNFSPAFICRVRRDDSGEVPVNYDASIDTHMRLQGVAAFMVEVGGGAIWDDEIVARAIDGFLSCFRDLGMLADDAVPAGRHGAAPVYVTDREHITVSSGGFFRPFVKPCDLVKAGTKLGEIVDVFGRVVEEPTFDSDVRIIAMRKEPRTHVGDRVAFVAHEWK